MENVITLNGEEILRGDPTSIGVIFNNLAAHDEAYRQSMDSLFNVRIKGTVCLLDGQSEVMKEIRI